MSYITEHIREKHWRCLEQIRAQFQIGYLHYDLYPRCVFDDRAKQTYMECVGYIMGLYRSGSIGLAGTLAYNLIEELDCLCHKSQDTAEQSMLAFVHTDSCNLSFSFGLFYQLPEGMNWKDELVQRTHKLRAVREHKNRDWALYYNGGVIFCAGGRRPHTLNVGDQAWSTHT